MYKKIIGVVLGLSIGAACRYLDITVPAPPAVFGAIMILAMTIGFQTGGRFWKAS